MSKPKSFKAILLSILFLSIGIVFAAQLLIVKGKAQNLFSINTISSQVETPLPVLSQSPRLETPRNLVAAYYDVQNYPGAKLLLNNKGMNPVEIRPTLYNLDGLAMQIAPILVEASSSSFINLSDWANQGGESFKKGSLKISHTGKNLVIGSQIYLEDKANSLSFEESLTELDKLDSRRLEAIWTMPRNQTQATIILSNTSDETISVTARLSKRPQKTGEAQTFTFLPHQTRVLDLRNDFIDGNQFADSDVVGLSLEYDGEKNALKAHGQIKDTTLGYSNIIAFGNPNSGKSSELHGTGLHLGRIGNEDIQPFIAVKNTGNDQANVIASVSYTRTDGTNGTVNLESVNLKAGEIRLLNIKPIIQKSRQEQIEIAGVELAYDTAPGSIIAVAQSVSESYNQIFDIPMADPLGRVSSTGDYPWRIEETSRTVAYIKNMTDLEQEYGAHLRWAGGGQYIIGLKKIAPRATVEIDVKKLRDEQTPDFRGTTIPLNLTNGQIKWSLHPTHQTESLKNDQFALIGRSEQLDTINKINSSYISENCCSGGYTDAFISPDIFVVAPPFSNNYSFQAGNTVQFYAFVGDQDCFQYTVYYQINAQSWSSSNHNVATVSSSGSVSITNPGQVNISAKVNGFMLSEGPCGPLLTESCPNIFVKETKEKPVSMLVPPCGGCQKDPIYLYGNASINAVPGVIITPFAAVGKDSTFAVAVQVTNNPNNSQITLNLRKISGTGESVFSTNNSSTLNITQSGNYEIKGITESSAKDNYIIETKFGSIVLPDPQSKDLFSIAKVKISRTIGTQQPTDITDTTITTIVGERLKLSAEILPSGLTVATHAWIIPEKRVKDFVVTPIGRTPTKGEVISVDGLNTASVNFVWVDANTNNTNKQVDYTATISGAQIKGKAIFNVTRPVNSLTSLSGSTVVSQVGETQNGPFFWTMFLDNATSNLQGTVFTRGTQAIPSPFSGTFQFVQLINANVFGTLTNNQQVSQSLVGLDGCYPYGLNDMSVPDNPNIRLNDTTTLLDPFQTATYNGQWNMFLMFKPSGDDSIWVPLKKINWAWNATATRNRRGEYTAVATTNPTTPATGADTTDYPIWNQIAQDTSGGCTQFSAFYLVP